MKRCQAPCGKKGQMLRIAGEQEVTGSSWKPPRWPESWLAAHSVLVLLGHTASRVDEELRNMKKGKKNEGVKSRVFLLIEPYLTLILYWASPQDPFRPFSCQLLSDGYAKALRIKSVQPDSDERPVLDWTRNWVSLLSWCSLSSSGFFQLFYNNLKSAAAPPWHLVNRPLWTEENP